MTTGQMVFYSGVGLLALTVLLAVFFLVKKPKYIPESVASAPGGPQQTQKLRNGYPTDHETRRRGGGADPARQATAPAQGAGAPTELQTAAATELMAGNAQGAADATEKLV